MMKYNDPQYDKDFSGVLLAPAFNEEFLAFIGNERERLGEAKFSRKYPLYGFEELAQ